MDQSVITKLTTSFNELVYQTPDEAIEFWYARDIMAVLGYERWENFSKVIQKASIACETAGGLVDNHFRGVTKMVQIASERNKENINDETYKY